MGEHEQIFRERGAMEEEAGAKSHDVTLKDLVPIGGTHSRA